VPGQERQNAIRREPGKNHRASTGVVRSADPSLRRGRLSSMCCSAQTLSAWEITAAHGALAFPAARLRDLSTSINEDKQSEQHVSAGDLRCGDREFTCVDSGNMWFLAMAWRIRSSAGSKLPDIAVRIGPRTRTCRTIRRAGAHGAHSVRQDVDLDHHAREAPGRLNAMTRC